MYNDMTPPRESRILIVDDDAGTIRVLAQILKDLGKVYFTTKGTEALNLARNVLPDLILLDVEMGDINGFSVCTQLKAEPEFADVPILFVTAYNEQEFEAVALTSGAIDYIHKPPYPQVVQARVRNYLALKHQTDRLRQLSAIDGLTGIANRRAFDQTLEQEFRRSCRTGLPLSLLMLDVDYFKRYNDRYGHQAGDDCLRAVASTIAATARRPGECTARYGGEEFAVILPNCTLEQAQRLAENIRQKIAELAIPHADSEAAPTVTISLGAADLSSHCSQSPSCWRKGGEREGIACGMTPGVLVNAADQALYEAKRSGRNRVAVAPPLVEPVPA